MPQIFKVLPLHQPWATLFAHGIKKIETRPKPTSWRGTYLIHANLNWTPDQVQIAASEPFFSALQKLGFTKKPWNKMLPLGCIIGSIEVTECIQIPSLASYPDKECFIDIDNEFKVSFQEWDFGDYTRGRYAWLTQNPRVLKTPFPWKGQQGYYQDFDGDVNQLIFK